MRSVRSGPRLPLPVRATRSRRVDLGHVTAFARFARAGGVRRFVLVSSVGADPAASNFYLRVKGQAERAVAAIGFEQLDILRPGLLLGARSESRRRRQWRSA